MTTVYTADPDMIWGGPGLSRAFYTNCDFRPIADAFQAEPVLQANQFRNAHSGELLISSRACDALALETTDEILLAYASMNKELVCHAKQVAPLVYRLE